MIQKVKFSINEYDNRGDLCEEGIYLHFGATRVRVAEDIDGYDALLEHLKDIRGSILIWSEPDEDAKTKYFYRIIKHQDGLVMTQNWSTDMSEPAVPPPRYSVIQDWQEVP